MAAVLGCAFLVVCGFATVLNAWALVAGLVCGQPVIAELVNAADGSRTVPTGVAVNPAPRMR